MRGSMRHTSPAAAALLTFPTHTASLNSYVTACRHNPVVSAFDSSLRQRSSNLFREFNGPRHFSTENQRGNIVNPSAYLLVEVCKFIAELSKDVVNIIVSSKEEFSKSKEIKSLVDLYYESTNRTLDLFNTVEKCVSQVGSSQLLIRAAIQRFERESMDTDVGGNNRYAVTLDELNRVKAMGDPFGDEFATQYKAVYDEQVNLLDKLRGMQEELDNNKSHVQKTRTKVVGSIVLVATLFTALALSMFSLTIVSPAVVAGLAVSAAGAGAGLWVTVMLNDYDRALATQNNLVSRTENRTKLDFEAMKTIKSLVGALIIRISSVLDSVEVAVERREDEAVRLAMQEIIQKVKELAEINQELGANVATCRKMVVLGKVRVLEHMDQLH